MVLNRSSIWFEMSPIRLMDTAVGFAITASMYGDSARISCFSDVIYASASHYHTHIADKPLCVTSVLLLGHIDWSGHLHRDFNECMQQRTQNSSDFPSYSLYLWLGVSTYQNSHAVSLRLGTFPFWYPLHVTTQTQAYE